MPSDSASSSSLSRPAQEFGRVESSVTTKIKGVTRSRLDRDSEDDPGKRERLHFLLLYVAERIWSTYVTRRRVTQCRRFGCSRATASSSGRGSGGTITVRRSAAECPRPRPHALMNRRRNNYNVSSLARSSLLVSPGVLDNV